jgi:DNA-binding transcriptional MerR regulator
MKPDPSPPSRPLPVYDEATDVRYTIEVIAELAGIEPRTVLHYQEQGFIRPAAPVVHGAADPGDAALFDAESLRQLRRIEHLRATCEMNDAGLKLILDLLHEIECLREERRQRLR